MKISLPVLTRRAALRLGMAGTTGLLAAPAVLAQGSRSRNEPPTVLQIVDTAIEQQDVAKDFFIGSLAAWQDFSKQDILRGRTVVHRKLEIDSTAKDWSAGLAELRDNPSIVAVSGSVSEGAARQLAQHLAAAKLPLAHVAPWLHDIDKADERTFPIFANRQMQIRHALRSLSMVGVREIGAVYATSRDRNLYKASVANAAAALKLQVVGFEGADDPRDLGRQMSARSPVVMLFLGGTPELARFTQGLADQSRQRYVVALAEVNLQILRQMGAVPTIPVIGAQVVPLTRSQMPVVQAYRGTLARLFDEPTSSLSLAGYLGARYTQQVLAAMTGPIDRPSVLSAFQQRQAIDLGGFRVAYDAQGLGSTYVTQSMLTVEGREVG
ncbi:ABC transporter substrate-binding protein [Ottowia thiooxydans]